VPDVSEQLFAALADRYRIERELGAGGMATVYLATELKHERRVALKVLRPELALVLGAERFLTEIKITARLDHPHILALLDSGAVDGWLYYVLPYVHGESLRALLDRENQLGITDALAIARQIAGALDYAHRQGVIHRDVKPENILMREGEAMLTDFGIAIAVQEAGGTRLTESGLSLGTPKYMSPEQATSDHRLDGRTDEYSLAAVLYEMLAGEPPITGANAQAMVAKLLTERPTPLNVVRDTVPEAASKAVARALAKTPADRFGTSVEFIDAVERGFDARPESHSRRQLLQRSAVVVTIAAAAAIAVFAWNARLGRPRRSLALGEKTQLTNSANVLDPVISADGKQLAYFYQRCVDSGCTYDIDVQDVGGTTTRTILRGATAEYGLEWSPDRRNLLAFCTFETHWGTHLVSALGGSERFIGGEVATFSAGGDSVLVGPPLGHSLPAWIRVTSLGGDARDSIRVTGIGTSIGRVLALPGTPWLIVEIQQGGTGLWETIDRHGKAISRLTSGFVIVAGWQADDALWITGAGGSVLRVPIDRKTGRFQAQWDTIPGPIDEFSVTADGRTLVTNQGTYDYGVWRVALSDLLAGRLPAAQKMARSSTPIQVEISPNGGRLRWIREVPAAASGGAEKHVVVTPYSGADDVNIDVSGSLIAANWTDSVTLAVATRRPPNQVHLALVDVRTGIERHGFDLPPDSDILDFAPVANGWSWIPAAGDRIVVRQDAQTRVFPKPPWVWLMGQLLSDDRGRLISYLGWGSSLEDSLNVGEISLDDGSDKQWARVFAENGGTVFLPDGSMLFVVFETEQTVAIYRLDGPGRMERLGTIPRPVFDVSVANDLHRAVVTVREYHADAWMTRILQR
jgi:tRNA A-37 threonylcarbamoyl transferase component Bud32